MRKLYELILTLCLVLSFSSGTSANEIQKTTPTTQATTEVQNEVASQTQETRNRIIQEAVDALSQTHVALTALDAGQTKDAMDALAMIVGKLELIVARYPNLALAATSMSVETRDLYGTTAAVKGAIDHAKKFLADGNLQAARHLLQDLGSEVVISLTNLPLATYPDAIKVISPLIDDGKIDEARAALESALNTLVVTEQVVPLPIIRSQAMLTIAEALADQKNRTEEQQNALTAALAAVQEQAKLAELLGYGEKAAYKKVYRQLGLLEKQLQNEIPPTKQFAETREALGHLWQS